MKKIVLVLLVLTAFAAQSQNDSVATPVTDTIRYWKSKGNFSAMFNQSTFDNWLAGGENNISGTLGLNYDINYSKKGWDWDNKSLLLTAS